MGTDEQPGYAVLLSSLGDADWVGVIDGVAAAEVWLRAATPGDHRINEVVSKLLILANHSKWEIRRAVANAAAQVLHPGRCALHASGTPPAVRGTAPVQQSLLMA